MSGMQMALGEEPPPEPEAIPCEPHEPGPGNINDWLVWAEARAAAGWTQRQCRGCGLHVVWTAPGERS